MTSNDNAITLTTHRVIQKTSEINKEILLKDIVSHEVIKKRHKYYKILSLLFGIPTLILSLLYFTNHNTFESTIEIVFERPNENEANATLIVLLILAFISFYLMLTTSEKWIKLSGQCNEIEFTLKDLSDSSLNKFLNRLTVESDNRKRED